MKKKRERLDVIHDILATIQSKQELGPTRLLQLSNLSPKMFRDYLDDLLESCLVKELGGEKRRTYVLTEKGHRFLEQYRIFSNFVEQLGL